MFLNLYVVARLFLYKYVLHIVLNNSLKGIIFNKFNFSKNKRKDQRFLDILELTALKNSNNMASYH